MDRKIIYLDDAATTPLAKEVIDAMTLSFKKSWANASSEHILGKNVATEIRDAIEVIANFLGVDAKTLTLTSGSTESINLALIGVMRAQTVKKHIIAITTEHKATLQTMASLKKEGFDVTFLSPNDDGQITKEMLKAAIKPTTALFTSLWVNNETGEIYDIEGFSEITKAHDVLFHVDATQAMPHFKVDHTLVDLMSFTAHKIYGPKGIGVLYKKSFPKIAMEDVIHGAKTELGNHVGTLMNHQILGFSKAVSLLESHYQSQQKTEEMRCAYLLERLAPLGVTRNGKEPNKIPSIINIHVPNVLAELLMGSLPHICMARGSACNSDTTIPSHVLTELHYSYKEARESVRISVGRYLLEYDFRKAVDDIYHKIEQLQKLAIGKRINCNLPIIYSMDNTYRPNLIEAKKFTETDHFYFEHEAISADFSLKICDEIIHNANLKVVSTPFTLFAFHTIAEFMRGKSLPEIQEIRLTEEFFKEPIPKNELHTIMILEKFLRDINKR